MKLWTEEQLQAFVAGAIKEAGGAYIDRRRQKELLKNVRKNVPSSLDKKILKMFDQEQGPGKVGRPRKDKNVREN